MVLRARSAALHSKNRAVLILANAMLDAVGGPPRKDRALMRIVVHLSEWTGGSTYVLHCGASPKTTDHFGQPKSDGRENWDLSGFADGRARWCRNCLRSYRREHPTSSAPR